MVRTKNKALQSALTAGLLVLGLGVIQKVKAASTDTMNVMVTAGNVSYGVSIASPMAGGYQFGTVNLSATTNSTVGITVYNSGTISEYFSMAISSTSPSGGSDNWGPSAAPGTDLFALFGYFASSMTATPPPTSVFGSGNASGPALALTAPNPVGSANLFGEGTPGLNARTRPTAGYGRLLWLQLQMPTDLTDGNGGAQTMVLSIDGQSN